MQLNELTKKAVEIRRKYEKANRRRGYKTWSVTDYFQGFVGDVGDLGKVIMAQNNLRQYKNQKQKLAHELSDCLWSLLVIAEALGINLEREFLKAKLSTLGKKKGHP